MTRPQAINWPRNCFALDLPNHLPVTLHRNLRATPTHQDPQLSTHVLQLNPEEVDKHVHSTCRCPFGHLAVWKEMMLRQDAWSHFGA
jgi:hypothetical protein